MLRRSLRHQRSRAKLNRFNAVLAVSVIILLLVFIVINYSYTISTFGRSIRKSNAQSASYHLPKCESFGCPIYPLEFDDPKVKTAIRGESNHDFAGKDFATVTRQSNQHIFNQDKATFIRHFVTKQSPPNRDSWFAGIFDGHGEDGHLVAAYVATTLPGRLAEKLNSKPCCQSDQWIQHQINQTFVEIDAEAPPTALRGGCTASVSIRLGMKLFVANTGDSRTIIATYLGVQDNYEAQVEISFATRFDKANLPEEKARIERLGGTVRIPKDHPNQSRVIVYSVAAIPHEPIGLAMSRSLGDWEWGADGVIPEPLINVIDLSNSSKSFVVAASDGLWDMRFKPDYFARWFGNALFGKKEPLLNAAVDVILEVSPAQPQKYRDDMTVIVIKTSD